MEEEIGGKKSEGEEKTILVKMIERRLWGFMHSLRIHLNISLPRD